MSRTILIAEDEDTERAAARQIVENQGNWRIVEARDGQEALDKLCDGLRPQLCLFDLSMPKIGGIELLQRIRRDPDLRSLRVMIASASTDRDVVVQLAQLKIEAYLLKPFQTEKAVTIFQSTLASIPDPDAESPAHRSIFSKSILIVEDDPVARQALRKIVQRDALWEIVEAETGAQALAKLEGGLKPTLCLVDLNLPEMDGSTLISRLRADPKLGQLRIAVVSGVQDRDQIRHLAQLRIDAYLLKPLNTARVEAVLKAAAPF